MNDPDLTPELLLTAYASGLFPMADGRDADEVFWVDPTYRGVFPLDSFHISRSLRRRIKRDNYQVRFNTAFRAVVLGCAERDETWINDIIFDLYLELHRLGYAHSVEVWQEDDLVGGVYGVALGGAFFGESMFSTRTDASKIALTWLIDRLRLAGFSLFDTQFITTHLASLGATEIPRESYQKQLASALQKNPDITLAGRVQSAAGILQRNAQTS